MKKDLSVMFNGFHCENPFLLSSSCVGANTEMCARAFEMGWAGVVFKTIANIEAEEVSPRFSFVSRTPNSLIGLKNLEMRAEIHTLEENFEFIRKLKESYPEKLVASSIAGATEEEWTSLAKMSEEAGADMIELNFSCPHVVDSDTLGAAVGEKPEVVKRFCQAARKGTSLPLIAKMTVNATHMELPSIAAIEGGADSISAINTIRCITGIDLDSLVGYPNIHGKSAPGGYSGNAVKPIALRFIQELSMCDKLKGVPLSGMGGIETWRDAIEFILMGATTIQATTSIMQYGYRVIDDLISGTESYLESKNIDRVSELIGKGLPNMLRPDELVRGKDVLPIFHPETCIGCGRCLLSCRDGGHQAIDWDAKNRLPIPLYDKCVGCHLCTSICPVHSIEYAVPEY